MSIPRKEILLEVMQELSSSLRRSLRTSSALSHALTTGEFREALVAQALRKHLPGRYELSSGIVVNAADVTSGQQDLIVTDRMETAPFLAEGVIGLHPAETVRAVTEIKSTASPADVRDAVDHIAQCKTLIGDEPRPFTRVTGASIGMGETTDRFFGGILAFRRKGSVESLYGAFVDACAAHPAVLRPNALVVLDEFAITWASGTPPDIRQFEPTPANGDIAYLAPLGANAFLMFWTALVEMLTAYEPPKFDPWKYVLAAGGTGAHTAIVTAVPEPAPGARE